MNDKKRTVMDDIKDSKVLILGVIGFVTAVTAFLVGVFGWGIKETTIVVALFGAATLFFSFLILRSERRHSNALQEHVCASNKLVEKVQGDIDELKDMLLETRRDTLRIQLVSYLQTQPENTDTILRLAEEYFIGLKGDWYMTSEFNKWARERDIIVPESITKAITENEKKRKFYNWLNK